MSIHPTGNDEPEVLLKRSPVLRDVTTAHISPTIRLSNDSTSTKEQYNKALPPLPVARKLSIENTDSDNRSGYKSLSSIPGAGRNLQLSENKNNVVGNPPNNSNTTKNNIPPKRLSTEKLTAPLTIIVPNISQAFARHSRLKSGDDGTDLSEKTISMELLNPKATDNR